MKLTIPRAVFAVMVLGAITAVACASESNVDTGKVEQQVKETGTDLKKSAQDAWASLSTDADRLVNQVQTSKDVDAKKQLLDKCRATEQTLKKANSNSADRTTTLCDRIRDADVNTPTVWNDIKNELKSIGTTISGS